MTKFQNWSLFLLRITIGWLFLNAGLNHLLDPAFSAVGYLNKAATFSALFNALASPSILPIVNFLVIWGLILLGIALILGIFVRWSGYLGAVLMFLLYLPVLNFPVVGHGYIVDDHIIFIAGLLTLAAFKAGRVWGLAMRWKWLD